MAAPLKAFRNGAPGEIRTPDPLVRSQVLYPAELRARYLRTANNIELRDLVKWRRERDSNPRYGINRILP